MKKILLSLAAVAFALPCAYAQEVTLDFTGKDLEKYGIPFESGTTTKNFIETPYVIEEGDVTFTLEPVTNGGYARCGNTLNNGLWISGTANDAAISIAVPDGVISRIEFRFTSMGYPKFDVDGVNVPYDDDANAYIWTGAKSKVRFDFVEGGQYITNVKINYSTGATVKEEAGLSFDATSVSVKLGEEFTPPALINPNGLAVTWESGDVAVATVDAEGNVTIAGKGTTVITAVSEATDKYEAGSASYTLKVYEEGEDPGIPVENEVIFDFASLSSSTTVEWADSPYILNEGIVKLTFDNEVNRTGQSPFGISSNGLTVNKGEGTITVAAEGKKITKIVAVTPAQITLSVGGRNLVEEYLPDYSSEYTWERPDSFTENDVVVNYNTNVWGSDSPVILTTIAVYYEDAEISGVEAVDASETDAVYYTLQGVKVTEPAPGIYVKVSGSKAQKVIIR